MSVALRSVVIDTCATINLLATSSEVAIVRALAITLIDTPPICDEATGLWTLPDAEGVQHKQPTSTRRLRDAGLLHTRALDTDELIAAYLACAAVISDGDASCIALAGVLGLPLVTDDRKARKIALDRFPAIELIGTLDLIVDAAAALGWDRDEMVQMAFDLRWRGRFLPPRQARHADWYRALLER